MCVETGPQNPQQQLTLPQMEQPGPFQGKNAVPLLVACVVYEALNEAEHSRTPIASFE